MKKLMILCPAAALLLAPLVAATPDAPGAYSLNGWIMLLSALVLLAAALHAIFAGRTQEQGSSWTALSKILVVFVTLALLSLVARFAVQHSLAFLGPMLRAWEILVADLAVFVLARQAALTRRSDLYVLVLATLIGAAIMSGLGIQEYLNNQVLAHKGLGDPNARVGSTSSPDFLAGYLVVALPATLALFLGASSTGRAAWLFGLVLVLELGSIWASSSRFALVSLAISLAVFGVAYVRARRQGLQVEKTTRQRLLILTVIVVLAGIVALKPVLNRLLHPEANSAAFRVWTWRGTVRMAKANPILGTGIGSYQYLYPRYALTGFTRLAHNSYLQTAAEMGIPALLILLTALGLILTTGWRGLSATSTVAAAVPEPVPASPPVTPTRKSRRSQSQSQSQISSPAPVERPLMTSLMALIPLDDRLLLCGLLAGIAAGLVQNVIDSDWSVFAIGLTFWAWAGLAVGLGNRVLLAAPGESDETASPSRRLLPVGIFAGLLCLLSLTESVADFQASHAQDALSDPPTAEAGFAAAMTWDPINARYPSDLGYKVMLREGNFTAAEAALRTALRWDPTGVNSHRLGQILEQAGRPQEALQAYQRGLPTDPNSLDLLLAAARLSPPDQALIYDQKVTALETSPVGTVRALGETAEIKFAFADSALGDAMAARQDMAQVQDYDKRAARVLESYISEGGSTSPQRMAMAGGQPDPQQDQQLETLYQHIMTQWIAASTSDQRPILQTRFQKYDAKFKEVFVHASQSGKT